MRAVQRITRGIIEGQGWTPGTTLENQVAFLLARYGFGPNVISQQHRVGKYRLDFAHAPKLVAIEADGWQHRSPEGAARDADRDSWLRSQGWLVLRVDDRHGEDALIVQVARVARYLHADNWTSCT